MIDGSFFHKRVQYYYRKFFAQDEGSENDDLSATQLVDILLEIQKRHLKSANNQNHSCYHYHSFYYDCPPLDFSIHYPVPRHGESGCRMLNFSKQPRNLLRKEFLERLKKQRKFALRLGKIQHHKEWALKSEPLRNLLQGNLKPSELRPNDFYYVSKQKGVDAKLGIDVATLAYEGQVEQIILIAGDSDFVPAAKLARRKGIDFVLDSLRHVIDGNLDEHIDGLKSYDLMSIIQTVTKQEPCKRPKWWN